MSAIAAWALLLSGVVLGACLPVTVRALVAWLRRTLFRPTLLQLDPPPARAVGAVVPGKSAVTPPSPARHPAQ
jgi:hypothetical protein